MSPGPFYDAQPGEAGAASPSGLTGPEAGPDVPGADLSTWFLRFNPFARARFCDASLVEALQGLIAADTELRTETESCANTLYRAIGREEDPERRKALVTMRRAVSRGRRPAGTDLPGAVRQWTRALDRQDRAARRVQEAYPTALHRERHGLATMLADPNLTDSLALLAPEVHAQAERYRQTVLAGAEVTGRIAKSERGLLQYVTRAATRTSPLARLTSVALTDAGPSGQGPGEVEPLDGPSRITLDRVMLDYVIAGLQRRSGAEEPDPYLTIPPTAAVDAAHLFFLSPAGEGYRRSAVALNGLIGAAVAILSNGPVRRSALAPAVAQSLGTGRVDEVGDTLDRAVDAGMLGTTAPSPDDGSLVAAPPAVPADDGPLGRIAEGIRALSDSTADDRVAAFEDLEHRLADLSRRSGRPARIAVNEDHLVRLPTVDPRAWGAALDDLGAAVGLLHVFDWLADVGVCLEHAFIDRHGRGAEVSLMEAAPDLVDDVTRAAERMTALYQDPDADLSELLGPGDDRVLLDLYTVRRTIENEVADRLRTALDHGREEVVLAPEEVRRWHRQLPSRLTERPLGYGVLVQEHEGRLVVNDGLPGHGMLYSRFLGRDVASGGTTLSRLRRRVELHYGEPGVDVVEDRSHRGLNVNVHPPVLRHGLEPADWPRLSLRHDPDSGRLGVCDGERRLKVLPLGGGHPGLYPPALSVASGLVIAGRLYNGLPDVFAARGDRDPATTRTVPRMLVGDVIVSRRRWYPGEDLATALACVDEVERLIAVTRWRHAHGVPAEVFVKSPPGDEGPASVSAPAAYERRSRAKPQYVDLTSALGVRVLPRMLARRGGDPLADSYIEEAAPTVVEGRPAREWVVEVDRRPHGQFEYGAVR
jgi:hypothetical protein